MIALKKKFFLIFTTSLFLILSFSQSFSQESIFIVDDVLTAGTAVKESAEIINTEGGNVAGVIILLDRQEQGTNNLSAIQEIEDSLNIKVISIINIKDIVEYLSNEKGQEKNLASIKEYQKKYGIK